MNLNIQEQVVLDAKGKPCMAVDFLSKSLGLKLPKKKFPKPQPRRGTKRYMHSVPWKYDFKNNCVKCNRAYHLQKHHITYSPPLTVFLCEKCHSKITGINTTAAKLFKTSKYYKPSYTNKIRAILWRWFIDNPWPKKNGSPMKTLEKSFLHKIILNYKLSPLKLPSGNAGEQPNESKDVTAFKLGLQTLIDSDKRSARCAEIGSCIYT